MDGRRPVGIADSELTGEIGPPDVTIMRAIRDLFLEEEPLVEDASFDSVLQPRELTIEFSDGIGPGDHCR